MIKQEIVDHILLHLQSIRKGLSILEAGQVMPDTRLQLEFDMYEIGEHLGLSPAEVNSDIKKKYIIRQIDTVVRTFHCNTENEEEARRRWFNCELESVDDEVTDRQIEINEDK